MIVTSICGATATGKSDLAYKLAQKLKCEIISFDSVQVYKYLDIGSAKPNQEMLSKIPHHFIDHVMPNHEFTAGDFRRECLELLKELSKKYSHTVLVGGTGFYLMALLKGMHEIPKINPQIKKDLISELKSNGLEPLWNQLAEADPIFAGNIHRNDQYRILRGLEVMRGTGKTPSRLRDEFKPTPFPYELHQYGLRRKKSVLTEIIQKRSENMINDGLVEETKALREKFGPLRALESVGYHEAQQFLDGLIENETDLALAISRSTLKLAKRQSTWFKRDPEIQWFDPDEDSEILEKILSRHS